MLVAGFSFAAYYIVERKFTYEKFNDNIDDLEAILKVEKRLAKKMPSANREEEDKDNEEHEEHKRKNTRMKNLLADDKDA